MQNPTSLTNPIKRASLSTRIRRVTRRVLVQSLDQWRAAAFTRQNLANLFPLARSHAEILPAIKQAVSTNLPISRAGSAGWLAALPEVSRLRIIQDADRAANHIFDLLGSGPVQYGARIDWHSDPSSAHTWDPRQYWAWVRPARSPGGFELKAPWELSRCQHFVRLGQAAWITGDEKYAAAFASQVKSWLADNPWPLGVNWACPMEVAIRMVNWIWGLAFFNGSPALTDDLLAAIVRSLLQHGRHVRSNLEWSPQYAGNHYLANLTGLFFAGILLQGLTPEAQEWLVFSQGELEREILIQVNPDGMAFEASTSYHRLDCEFFLTALVFAEHNGISFSPAYRDRLTAMLEFIQAVTAPDGRVPQIGDNDSGRLQRLNTWANPDHEWSDFRYLLAVGAVLCDRPDWGLAAADQVEEALWLLGRPAVDYFRRLAGAAPPEKPAALRVFPESGLVGYQREPFYLLFRLGNVGQKGMGGHAHADALAFELYFNGQPWLIDPGTFTYSGDYSLRNHFRSSLAHNTLTVDDQEIYPFHMDQLWNLESSSPVITHSIRETEYGVEISAAHFGYQRLKDPVQVQRTLALHCITRTCRVEDAVLASGSHELVWTFQCSPHVQVHQDQPTRVTLSSAGGDQGTITWEARPGSPQSGPQVSIDTGLYSPGYGMMRQAPRIRVKWETQGDITLITTISDLTSTR